MPVIPNALERLFLRSKRAPVLFLDIAGSGALRAGAAGVRLGVFDALREGPRNATEVARAIRSSERGTAAFLEALVALGYLRKSGGAYANTAGTAAWLTSGSATDWSPVARWWDEIVFRFWDEHLEASIRRGSPRRTIYEWLNDIPDGWRIAQGAFAAYARPVADRIASKVLLPPSARRLVDVGGGHGLYTIAFCRRHPGLTATIVDSPKALEPARENIAAAGMTDRIEMRAADIAKDDLGEGYDIALLFSIVHGFSREQNLSLLRNVARALNPGGLVAILENDPTIALGPVSRAFAGILELTYVAGLGGQMHSPEDIRHWLEETGFRDVKRTRLRRALSALLLGTKAG